MTISALQGRALSGTPVSPPAPPRPQVGDCTTVPVLASQPCQGARAGEVVSVEDGTGDAGSLDCYRAGSVYLGLPDVERTARAVNDQPPTVWTPRAWVVADSFRPSLLQKAAGQRWQACVLIGTEGSTFQPLPFPQSPRAAAAQGGSAFDRFAACSGSPTPDRLIPCDWPHRYEFLADAIVVGGTEAASLAWCRAAITELTGLTDPTAGHRLEVGLLTYIFGISKEARTVSYDEARAKQGSATCAIAPTSADEMLTGTLYGLNGQPLPLR